MKLFPVTGWGAKRVYSCYRWIWRKPLKGRNKPSFFTGDYTMDIKPFAVEEWMNAYETGARYNIAETCVDSVSLDELFELSGTDKASFLNKLCARRLTYGAIEGSPDLKEGIASLYRTIKPGEIVPTHGASGGNHHVFYSLINPGGQGDFHHALLPAALLYSRLPWG